MRNLFIVFLIIAASLECLFAQAYSEQGLDLTDSLKNQEYPYLLPIYGSEVHKLGYKLPYSAGIGINYVWQKSDLIIDNLQVGFNNGPMTNLDEVIRFTSAVSAGSGVNLRPDIWLFPFLNVYGLFVQSKTSTQIDAGLWLPDTSNNWEEISAFSTKANFDATTIGFGFTPTFAFEGWWMALDMNMEWTDVSALDDPVFTFIFGPRFGKTYKFNDDMNIALWIGGFRLKFTSETTGSLSLNDLFNTDELQGKVDQGLIKVEEAQLNVNVWWEGLTPAEQMNPVNIVKYETANRTIQKTSDLLNSVDGALSNAQTATVQYSLDKNNENKWNIIVGTQFQINKSWMIRGEYGFLGSRNQFVGGLQYRFGL